MNSKEYTLPNGRKAVFEYDVCGVGQVALECMDELMAMIADRPQWTPVSEGLPKITDFYLIQYSREICGDEITVAYYSVEEKESDPNYEWEFKPHCGEYKEVIAWMPLPKPYEPQAEYKDVHCNCTDEEIAKSFISDVETVKDLLPQAESEDKE